MERRQTLMIAGGAIAALLLFAWVVFSDSDDGIATSADEADATADAPREEPPPDPRVRAADPEVQALARELRERIRSARTRREADEALSEVENEASAAASAEDSEGADDDPAGGGSAVNSEERPVGSLDPQYIRDAVHAIRPLIRECYELALSEDQSLEGRLVVEFDIEGEPDAGGVVSDTNIHEGSTLSHPTLEECVSETLYTLELPAPEGGGMVHVRYPFGFAHE